MSADATVLTWHAIAEGDGPTRIPPRVFHAQLAAIADASCVVVRLDDVAAWLTAGRSLPARAVALTFDDGFVDFGTVAWPALAARGWPATVFACAGRLGGRSDWDGAGRAAPLLDRAALRALAAAGAEVGSHAVTHVDLTARPEREAVAEIADSQARLADTLGRPVTAFAWPYGRSTPTLRRAAAARYRIAVGTAMRRVTARADCSDVPRVDMTYFRDARRLHRFLDRGRTPYFTLRRVLRRVGEVVRG